MAAEPSAPSSRFKPMTLALASTGVLAAWTALLPEADRPWNFAVLGAVGLFASARLPFRQAITVMLLAILVKDVSVYLTLGWPPAPLSWLGFAAYVLVGRALLAHTESPLRIGSGAVIASFLFFLVSNFGSWLSQALPYGYSFAGLVECYRAGILFYRGTLISDVLCTGALFALHAVLSRAYFPAERVVLQAEAAR